MIETGLTLTAQVEPLVGLPNLRPNRRQLALPAGRAARALGQELGHGSVAQPLILKWATKPAQLQPPRRPAHPNLKSY